MNVLSAASAANRFGMGARAGDLTDIRDPQSWLLAQIKPQSSIDAFTGLPSSADYLQRESNYRMQRQAEKKQSADKAKPDRDATNTKVMGFRQVFGDDRDAELAARYQVAVESEAGFVERLVRFWSNHFAVSTDKQPALLYAAPMEREAIRPHLNGRFIDLLLAVETHPAMLRYLDNTASVGADSRYGQRVARMQGKVRGLNENLAREIMELHTLGVDGGYTQADVTEFARALTGWGTPTPRDNTNSAFVFHANAHEPGARTVLGKRYPEAGIEQGRAILADLARHPATAKHVALKLSRHFVADTPPPALIDRLAKSYLKHDGDLGAVYRTLIESAEAWQPDARKFKTPEDFVVSAWRTLDTNALPKAKAIYGLLARLGQPPFEPRSPAGFSDVGASWMGSDALFKRIQASEAIANRAKADLIDAQALATSALGTGATAELLTAVRRAESPQQALALLYASPAFQWRV